LGKFEKKKPRSIDFIVGLVREIERIYVLSAVDRDHHHQEARVESSFGGDSQMCCTKYKVFLYPEILHKPEKT